MTFVCCGTLGVRFAECFMPYDYDSTNKIHMSVMWLNMATVVLSVLWVSSGDWLIEITRNVGTSIRR